MRLDSDLADWFHLLTAPADYAEEAAEHERVLGEAGLESSGAHLDVDAGVSDYVGFVGRRPII